MKGLDTHATESNEEDASSLRIEANDAGKDGGNVANNARNNACRGRAGTVNRESQETNPEQPRQKLHKSASATRSRASRNTPPALRRPCLSGAQVNLQDTATWPTDDHKSRNLASLGRTKAPMQARAHTHDRTHTQT